MERFTQTYSLAGVAGLCPAEAVTDVGGVAQAKEGAHGGTMSSSMPYQSPDYFTID